ncbi:MAG: hypothetical protein ACRENE_10920, partial [Polyangiaceae bacterium]
PATATATAAPTPATTATPTSTPTSRLSLSLSAFMEGGTLPGIASGGEVAIGWIYGGRAFRIRALGAVARYGDTTGRPGRTDPFIANEQVDLSLTTASLRGCVSLVRGVLDVGPCLGAQLGFVSAKANGVAGAGAGPATFAPPQTVPWLAIEAGVLGSWSMAPPLALFGRVDVLASPSQGPPSFVVDDSSTADPSTKPALYSVHNFAGRVVLGLEARFF